MLWAFRKVKHYHIWISYLNYYDHLLIVQAFKFNVFMLITENLLFPFLDSQFRESLNLGLLDLEEDGVLDKIKSKWWSSDQIECKVPILHLEKLFLIEIRKLRTR